MEEERSWLRGILLQQREEYDWIDKVQANPDFDIGDEGRKLMTKWQEESVAAVQYIIQGNRYGKKQIIFIGLPKANPGTGEVRRQTNIYQEHLRS